MHLPKPKHAVTPQDPQGLPVARGPLQGGPVPVPQTTALDLVTLDAMLEQDDGLHAIQVSGSRLSRLVADVEALAHLKGAPVASTIEDRLDAEDQAEEVAGGPFNCTLDAPQLRRLLTDARTLHVLWEAQEAPTTQSAQDAVEGEASGSDEAPAVDLSAMEAFESATQDGWVDGEDFEP